ncbi:CDP-alcohol phosphatidyltransferase family protein [Roseicyclus sp. F158]|uniref:CDP-alcohol phosphatidyltransferase family protein n=1 Tax=Tropicimonas omnivorans TaxID=3075590 RepID=A0ABU3DHY8_9RHOB|nr:CDP-alcohol phosphatidyltransferase family protein [Roseicyclus sp. F158]MDT0683341.1 CDP-alcohol phosphatidyltransferase family protein [Roseicyclus sp. F158]
MSVDIGPSGASPAWRMALVCTAIAPLALALGWGLAPSGVAVTAAIFLAGAIIATRGMSLHYPHGRVGACNLVTAIRLAMTAGLAASLAGGVLPGWPVFVLAILTLSLDGIDGWLARRQGLSSAFGARFDMEVDSALAAILALSLMLNGRAGPELLVLGFARYAFVAAGVALPWLQAPLPGSFRRKTVCVLQIGTLAALTAPLLPEILARPAALVAAALVAWSFGRDILWLARTR